MAGGMDSWGLPRRQLLWELGTLQIEEAGLDLLFTAQDVDLPEQTIAEAMLAEQAIMGLSPGDHVMTLYRARLDKQNILGSRALGACPGSGPISYPATRFFGWPK